MVKSPLISHLRKCHNARNAFPSALSRTVLAGAWIIMKIEAPGDLELLLPSYKLQRWRTPR